MPIASRALVAAFAPEGRLRASINAGNPVLAHRDAVTGEAGGVSVDLARALGLELGLGVELIVFGRAAQSVDAVRSEQADVGFFAIDPARSQGLRFTAPYVLIEGSYLVRQDSPVRDNAAVDRPGTRVAAGQADVAAGIRQVLGDWAAQDPSLRLLPGRFMVIRQAMGLPAGRGDEAAEVLAGFVERMKASGFVAGALARHGIEGASVAPG